MTEPEALAAEVRAALAERLRPARDAPAGTVLGAGSDDLEAGRAYLEALADGGWAVPIWPVDHGGMGLEPRQAAVVARELARFEQPDLYPYLVGISLVGPTLIDPRHRRAAGALAAIRSEPDGRSGASSSPSPMRARTWPGSPRGRCATATSGG